MVEEVKEPITVRYPLLQHVRDRFEILIAVLGAALGLVGAFAVVLFLGLDTNAIGVPVVSRDAILIFGLYAISLGMAGLTGGVVSILFVAVAERVYEQVST